MATPSVQPGLGHTYVWVIYGCFYPVFDPFCAVLSPFFRAVRLPGAKTERTRQRRRKMGKKWPKSWCRNTQNHTYTPPLVLSTGDGCACEGRQRGHLLNVPLRTHKSRLAAPGRSEDWSKRCLLVLGFPDHVKDDIRLQNIAAAHPVVAAAQQHSNLLSSLHMHEIAGLRNSQVEASPRAAADTPALVSGVRNLRRQEQSVAYLKQMLFARLVVWVCAWKSVQRSR